MLTPNDKMLTPNFSVMKQGRARSVGHVPEPNIFPSGPTTQ